MRYAILVAWIAMIALSGAGAVAAERTVTLAVDGMTCASCPYIVRKALRRVSGVETVAVSFRTKKAVVSFDDARTSIAALTEATAGAGFPSRPIE